MQIPLGIRCLLLGSLLFAGELPGAQRRGETALTRYLRQPDAAFAWKVDEPGPLDNDRVVRLKLTSQQWRDTTWKHDILLIRPAQSRHGDAALLLITGSKKLDRYIPYLRLLADQAGAPAAVVNNVPNQPLFGGKKEDALIAHTFEQYLKTGDESWPLLFPMVKSAVRAMDAINMHAAKYDQKNINRFVLTGASKRGWTTYLTGPQDRRVVGIAPMVFDILNMHVQTDWSQAVWGKQSEQISDYTERGLVGRSDDERRELLYEWIDPYVNRRRYTMPKLILLGTNDRYWPVDATRHYYHDFAEPKAIHQTPNLGHDIGRSREMVKALGAFFRETMDGEALPSLTTRVTGGRYQTAEIEIHSNVRAKSMRVWTATSSDRDFRDSRWTSTPMRPADGKLARYRVPIRRRGYQAVMFEATYEDSAGHEYPLSSQVIVTPDLPRPIEDSVPNGREPADDVELRRWLENLVAHHGFPITDVRQATGLEAGEIESALKRFDIKPFSAPHSPNRLKVLPFPGGWHPRVGFLDGCVDPQRETKLSVFTPWDRKSFVVVDVPEAIWSNLGLTYLAHTHVPTVWTEKGIDMKPLEWKQNDDGSFEIQRTLPNGIQFGCRAEPKPTELVMRLWLKNGTKEKLTGMRVQNCIMLKGAHEFARQSTDNNVLKSPFAACRNETGDRWVITAWTPCHRPWGNTLCPCLHSDPKFPDAEPGQTVEVKGWMTFHEGTDIDSKLKRLSKRWLGQ